MGILDWRGFPTMTQPLVNDPSDPRKWTIPENAPGAISGGEGASQGGLLSFLQQPRGPVSELAYNLAGRPDMKPRAGSMLDPVYTNDASSGGAGGGLLQDIQTAKKGYDLYNKLTNSPQGADMLPLDSSAGELFGTSASSALGANAAGALPLFGAGAVDLGTIGAGSLFGTSAAGALGSSAAAPISLFGSGATDLGTVGAGQLFGTSGSAAASGAVGSGAAPSATSSGSALAGLTGSGLTAGLTGLGLVAAAAPFLHGNYDNEIENKAAFMGAFPGVDDKYYGLSRGNMKGTVILPDGVQLTSGEFNALTNAWYNSNFETGAKQKEGQDYLADYQNRVKTGEGFFWAGKKNPYTGRSWIPGG